MKHEDMTDYGNIANCAGQKLNFQHFMGFSFLHWGLEDLIYLDAIVKAIECNINHIYFQSELAIVITPS